MPYFAGDRIQINRMTQPGYKQYFQDFKQNGFVERKGCKQYPTPEFQTYAAFLQERLATYPSCLVTLATGNNVRFHPCAW